LGNQLGDEFFSSVERATVTLAQASASLLKPSAINAIRRQLKFSESLDRLYAQLIRTSGPMATASNVRKNEQLAQRGVGVDWAKRQRCLGFYCS
jgi:hypothetical protein